MYLLNGHGKVPKNKAHHILMPALPHSEGQLARLCSVNMKLSISHESWPAALASVIKVTSLAGTSRDKSGLAFEGMLRFKASPHKQGGLPHLPEKTSVSLLVDLAIHPETEAAPQQSRNACVRQTFPSRCSQMCVRPYKMSILISFNEMLT